MYVALLWYAGSGVIEAIEAAGISLMNNSPETGIDQ